MRASPLGTEPEILALAAYYGQPLLVQLRLEVGALFDPVSRSDRLGEVALVLRRPDGRIWLMTKEFYPPEAYRLPTGGVGLGEPIGRALQRELKEETGFELEPVRFLASIGYEFDTPRGNATFSTYAFEMECGLEEPRPEDPTERIKDFRAVELAELAAAGSFLDSLPSHEGPELGNWRDWGRFRAVAHRVVYEALKTAHPE